MKVLDEKTFIPISSVIVLSGIIFSYSLIYFNVAANAKGIDEVKLEAAQYRKDMSELRKETSILREDVAVIKQILKEGN